MELVSPLTFIYTFYTSPLTYNLPSYTPHLSLSQPSLPPLILTAFFLTHYLNRAIISPLRAPSRSKSHIIVPLFAVGFNLVNGFLIGAYLSSPTARAYLGAMGGLRSARLWAGLALAGVGFVGNVLHDEILFDIRRKAKAKGKAKAPSPPPKDAPSSQKEHYAIPHGLLYSYISYPNYLCEWLEWLGFALAASPLPSLASPEMFVMTITPPWLFLVSEVVLMLPRALKGHQWYRERFEGYPEGRKAVVPFLI